MARIVIALLIAVSASAQAQQWNPAQQEVWNRVEACWGHFRDKALDPAMDCYHEAYRGWPLDSPAPQTKARVRRDWEDLLPRLESFTFQLDPLEIGIFGDVAVVHYRARSAMNLRDGTRSRFSERWTDVWRRIGGEWYWIGDSGGALEP